jgi:hypothetical protein
MVMRSSDNDEYGITFVSNVIITKLQYLFRATVRLDTIILRIYQKPYLRPLRRHELQIHQLKFNHGSLIPFIHPGVAMPLNEATTIPDAGPREEVARMGNFDLLAVLKICGLQLNCII